MKFKDVVDSLSDVSLSDLSFSRICMSLFIAMVISLWIFFTYRERAKNEFYSKNFNISLALMPVITTGIISAMQSNLVISLGMVGALSIVRYRTAIKNSLDLFFMFWAISVGIICGAEQYVLAIIMSLLVSFLLFLLSKLDFSRKLNVGIVRCEKIADLDAAEKDFRSISSFFKIKSKQINSELIEIIFEYKLRKNIDLTTFLLDKKYIKDFQMISND